MRFAFVVVLCSCQLEISGSSSLRLLARTSVQQLSASSALLGDGAEEQLGLGASLTTAPQCDSQLSGPICYAFAGRKHNLLPNAVPAGLIGHWKFDSDTPIDSSGNGNHGVTELLHGPSPAGNGHSAAFTKTFMMVPSSPQLKLDDFTYSFWIYLFDDGTPSGGSGSSATWCPFIRKGIHMTDTAQFASAPALLFNRRTGRLRAEVTTSVRGTEDGEHVESNARLLPNRWMHIAMVHHSKNPSLLLYVNGILDSVLKMQGVMVSNDYPLYVGGDPFTQSHCDFTVYMDELRIFSRAVPPHQLQAEAAPALGGTDPNYVRLGCLDCSLEEAAKSCPASRHVCTSIELHTGGYQVARSLGWLSSSTHVWTHAAVTKGAEAEASPQSRQMALEDPASASSGLGLCCEGPP